MVQNTIGAVYPGDIVGSKPDDIPVEGFVSWKNIVSFLVLLSVIFIVGYYVFITMSTELQKYDDIEYILISFDSNIFFIIFILTLLVSIVIESFNYLKTRKKGSEL
ncbi:MAG: hypothetical protein DRM99_00830 [Thermoplasmata archaeon]|nr:MAG: hypothetical protein DRM99_00830 [Thermoplasmata archaeon]